MTSADEDGFSIYLTPCIYWAGYTLSNGRVVTNDEL